MALESAEIRVGADTADPGYIPPTPDQTGAETADPGYIAPARTGEDTADPGYIPPQSNQNVTILPEVVVTAQRTSPVVKQVPLPNPLARYASYTYSLSLHLLSMADYNQIAAGGSYQAKNVIIASAGRHTDSTVSVTAGPLFRNEFFTEDFFFDDLRMKTFVNSTAASPSANLIEGSMTVIEPGGFSLYNRMKAASEKLGNYNWSKDPYLVQIDFYGTTDSGKIERVEGMTKRIPIYMTAVKSRLTARGTEYKITFVPYHSKIMSAAYASCPAPMKISGDTVEALLGGIEAKSIDTQIKIALANAEQAKAYAAEYADGVNDGSETNPDIKQVFSDISSGSGSYVGTGFFDRINLFYQINQHTARSSGAHRYEIKVHRDIGTAKAFPNRDNNANSTATKTGANSGSPAKLSFTGKELFVPAGTSFNSLIEYVITHSAYILEQTVPPVGSSGGDQNQQLNNQTRIGADNTYRHWRIIPQVTIVGKDEILKDYVYKIVYHIVPFYRYNDHPSCKYGGQVDGFAKKYDYMYTGQNTEVMDMSIEFNNLYYHEMHSPNSSSITDTNLKQQLENQTENSLQTAARVVKPDSGVQRPTAHYRPVDAKSSQSADANHTAVDITRNAMSAFMGDMISVKLKILGDPHFIKQDGVFEFAAYGTTANDALLNSKTGSIQFDKGEIYTWVNFQSPKDYNEVTGLANPNAGEYRYSAFSGKYGITTIENVFRGGKFEQELSLYRLSVQPNEANAATIGFTRAEPKIEIYLPLSAANPYARSFGGTAQIYAGGGGSGFASAATGAIAGAIGVGIQAAMSHPELKRSLSELGDRVFSQISDKFSSLTGDATTAFGGFTNELSTAFENFSTSVTDALGITDSTADIFSSVDFDFGGVDLGEIDIGNFTP